MILKNRFGLLYLLFFIFLILSAVVRTVLTLKSFPFLEMNALTFLEIYSVGFFFDFVTFFYIAVPFSLYLIILPDRLMNHRYHRAMVFFTFTVMCYLLIFDSVAEYIFFDEFGTRFNFIAVDYLLYTREVLGNIKESYAIYPILGAIFAASIAVFFLVKRYIDLAFFSVSTYKKRITSGLLFLIIPVFSFVFVDQSFSQISQNAYMNELAGNGIYDLFAAFRNNDLDYNAFYATKDDSFASERLKGLLKEKNSNETGSILYDVSREIKNKGPEKRLNVIVVVEESLSSEYLQTFGGRKGLTPNLDRLAADSLLFTRLYAAGTRTVRGLEAVTLALVPLPGTSLIKRPFNEHFFSWGTLMNDRGYDSKFIYGGYGYFDNMNYFFSNNGFEIVDRSMLSNSEITFSNIWGVCDEDLFRKVISEADKSYSENKPFFSIVMTTSNHRPFTYPEGKIDIPSHSGREGGVKYADYALGKFIEASQKEAWFKDTIIVIVADHCASSAGKTELPVKKFEIPLFIYSPEHVKPQRVDTMASQIDIAPTVLGILNFSYKTEFMGTDVLKAGALQQRAFISSYQKLGYLEADRMVILEPRKKVKFYRFGLADGQTVEQKPEYSYINDAISYYQGASYIYKHRLNRI